MSAVHDKLLFESQVFPSVIEVNVQAVDDVAPVTLRRDVARQHQAPAPIHPIGVFEAHAIGVGDEVGEIIRVDERHELVVIGNAIITVLENGRVATDEECLEPETRVVAGLSHLLRCVAIAHERFTLVISNLGGWPEVHAHDVPAQVKTVSIDLFPSQSFREVTNADGLLVVVSCHCYAPHAYCLFDA